ncbi:hypothetical protein [Brachybacterium sp. ACRRE]|uniref:hypothetical protein n=1 Tax=Brachybacterium sp. ACRRE TaxID=2918184 RepID=UPI001EF171C2|nr:hypothetical protein [Brachybacterium sp. ACRRE]MCG7308913.1 hypothetical protein [Brachybacterium sp. ACRRE]
MILSFASTGGAALCYGTGSVLQASAARRTSAASGLDPRLLVRLLRSWRYLIGIALDGLGFVLSLLAVRTLPLFVVQSVVASFLVVTAVLAAILLRTPLTRKDVAGIAVVVVGLVLVSLAAAPDRAVTLPMPGQWAVLGSALALVLIAAVGARAPQGSDGVRSAGILGAVAGFSFGVTAVAARVLPVPAVVSAPATVDWARELLVSPTAYALVVCGVLAQLAYSTALQRGSVTQATAPLVVAETLGPALVGVLALGDRPRAGWELAAVLGCLIATAGAVAIARFGEAPPGPTADAPETTRNAGGTSS